MKSTLPRAPSEEAAQAARDAARRLSSLLEKRPGGQVSLEVKAGRRKISIEVPLAAIEFFVQMLAEMADGNAVTMVPVQAVLTTQQTADLLNVSRPYLVSLLEEGRIPFHRVGTHRRVRFSDLLAYKQKDDAKRRRILAELTREGQKQNLGY